MKVFDSFSEWYSSSYKDRAPVIPAARSWAMQNEPRSQKAVLLVHGYAGYPGELVSVGDALFEAGFDVYAPRLPGMGTSGKDFIHTTRYDWMSVVDRATEFLCENYEEVSLLGHSMGCLLCVLETRVRKIRRLVLAMPAFSVNGLDSGRLKAISLIRKDIPKKWESDERYHLHYEDAPCDDASLGKEYYSHLYPAQLYQMALLSKEAGKAMQSLETPALILASKKDEIVDYSCLDDFAGKAKTVWIDNATHYVFYDIDPDCEKKAIEESVSFLKG